MTDTIPDWAGKRACELLNDEARQKGLASGWNWSDDGPRYPVTTVAKLVMQYEQPPVDPDEELVVKVINAFEGFDTRAPSFNARAYPTALARAVSQYKQEKGNG